MVGRLNVRTKTVNLQKNTYGVGKLLDIGFGNGFLDLTPKERQQSKKEQVGLQQTKKPVLLKGSSQQNIKAISGI